MLSHTTEDRCLTVEETCDHFDEKKKGRKATDTTGLPERKHPLDHARAFLSACSLTPFPP
jgi:hypothetical protein